MDIKKSLRILSLIIFFSVLSAFRSPNVTVYLCDSETAYAYHLSKNCRGLNNCKHEIIAVSKETAIGTYGRKICGFED
jgi:hypothetical protein